MKGTFSALDEKSKIFEELINTKPLWWKTLLADKELYIDVRKDNYINVYYYGGSVAKISYKKGFVAEIHQKYLGDKTARATKTSGVTRFEYDKIGTDQLISILGDIKKNIKSDYLPHIKGEKPAEKWLQGKLITTNSIYIDSEFQYNRDCEIGELRIDLIELQGGILSFVELKGITDTRLRNDMSKTSNLPEIIDQMEKYKLFIDRYATEIKDYYTKLISLKQKLGLLTLKNSEFELNMNPKLLIIDTYNKSTIKRTERIEAIEDLLKNRRVDYQISKL